MLTLGQALGAALLHNPELRATAYAVRAREAERLQARLVPNPELEVTAEDFGASGQLRGARQMELTFAVSQVIWLGGQRARRSRLAAAESREAGWRYELERLAVLTRTVQAFVAVVAVQQLILLAAQEEALAQKVVRLFQERSAAGRIARRDLGMLGAQVRLSRARLKREQLRRQLQVAKTRLAAQWGGVRARFDRAAGDLKGAVRIPGLSGLLARVGKSPRVRAWQARLATSRATVALARADAIPDLTLSGGVRVLPASRSTGFVLGLSIPLPVSDRNQGTTRAARFRVMESRARLRATRARVSSLVTRAHQRASAAAATISRIDAAILPKARMAVKVGMEGYREGKAGFLAVLDAQRTLVQVLVERLSAKTRLLEALADLELLLGEPLRARSVRVARRPRTLSARPAPPARRRGAVDAPRKGARGPKGSGE